MEGEGYRVLTAKDGVEAVEMFEANRDNIGLVVCDLGLPRLGGRDAFMRMKEQRPNVRAISPAAISNQTCARKCSKAGVIDTIQKPYDLREMLEKIRSVIGDSSSEENQPQLFDLPN